MIDYSKTRNIMESIMLKVNIKKATFMAILLVYVPLFCSIAYASYLVTNDAFGNSTSNTVIGGD